MPHISVYVEVDEVLSELDDKELLKEIKSRGMSLSATGDGYRLDRLISDLRDVVFEIEMGRDAWALKMLGLIIDQIESADRVLSNQQITYSTIKKPAPNPEP